MRGRQREHATVILRANAAAGVLARDVLSQSGGSGSAPVAIIAALRDDIFTSLPVGVPPSTKVHIAHAPTCVLHAETRRLYLKYHYRKENFTDWNQLNVTPDRDEPLDSITTDITKLCSNQYQQPDYNL